MTPNTSPLPDAAVRASLPDSLPPVGDDGDDPTRDYVARVYLGHASSNEFVQRTRRRIDWIASQCRGPHVLDIGCSEGILALLLAREGIATLGVDTNAGAIETALALLGEESAQVQARVRFHHGDLDSAAVEPATMDTLVMTEILEHLISPERLLDAGLACLRDGARVVITTPFGYRPDDDHRQEFGLAQFTDMVRRSTAIESIAVVDGYILYAGTRTDHPQASWQAFGERALIELGDDAARASQHFLYKHINSHKKRIATLEKRTREQSQDKTAQQLEKEQAEHRKLQLRVSTLDAQVTAQKRYDEERAARVRNLDEKVRQLTEQASAAALETTKLSVRNTELVARNSELAVRNAETNALLAAVRSQLVAQKQRGKDQRARIATFKTLATTLEARADLFEKMSTQNATRLQAMRGKLDALKKSAPKASRALETAKQRIAMLSASDKHYRHATRELRNSVSFRLGNIFVQAVERPLTGIVLIPFRFVAVVVNYLRTPRKTVAPGAAPMQVKKRKPAVAVESRPAPVEQPAFAPFVARKTSTPSTPVIATVLDEFSEQCFAPEAHLVPLSRREWRQQLDNRTFDLLLVESAWRGNHSQWKGKINRCMEDADATLSQLVATCRQRGIPTVFWNKEDPLNFDQFIAAAKFFDHVFTTDESLLPRYREELGHERVYALPFAAQPAIHNPVGRRDEFDVAFAGSWFAEKHDTRRAVLEPLLDAASNFDLQIFDRHSELADPRYAFPPKYQRWIRKALPYPQVLTAYRRFKVFLNANSVLESPSMFSRRVFELLACGTPVVSTPSTGMEAMLPGFVRVAHGEDEARAHIAELLENAETRHIEGHLAMREVLRSHTYRDRLATILERTGIGSAKSPIPKVSIVLCTNRPENLANCLHNVRRQTHPDIELLLVLNRNGVDLDAVRAQFAELPQVTVLHVDENASLYTCLNTAIAQCTGEFWSKMDDDNIYGDRYIEDIVRAMTFSGADIVGKAAYYTLLEHRDMSALRRMGPENDFTKFVQGGTITARVASTHMLRWSEGLRSGGDSQFLRDAAAAGLSIYSSDRFNFVSVRRGDEGAHTWTISDDDYLKRCESVRQGIDLSRMLI